MTNETLVVENDNLLVLTAETVEVLVDAAPQGLQGPPGISGVELFSRSNVGASALTRGMPVYGVSATQVDKASAAPVALHQQSVFGLVKDAYIGELGGVGFIQADGLLTGTSAQWDAITGMVGGLVANTDYFLDTTAGRMTPALPTGAAYVCRLGRAVSSTEFFIRIEPVIVL